MTFNDLAKLCMEEIHGEYIEVDSASEEYVYIGIGVKVNPAKSENAILTELDELVEKAVKVCVAHSDKIGGNGKYTSYKVSNSEWDLNWANYTDGLVKIYLRKV